MTALRSTPLLLLLAVGCGTPAAAPLTLTPDAPTTTDPLRAVLATPPTGALTYRWRWTVDGAEVPGATGDSIGPALTAKGQVWRVEATPIEEGVEGEPVSAEVTIADSAPSLAVVLTPKAPRAGDDLVAVPAWADADGDPVTLTWTWQREGIEVADLDGPVVPGDRVGKGERWSVSVVGNDGELDGEPATAEVSITNTPPVVTGVTFTPEQVFTDTAITVAATAEDADGDRLTLRYAWSVDGATLGGQTGTTLAPSFFRKGQVVSVRVTANDGAEDSAPVTSAPIPVRNRPPAYASVDVSPATGRNATVFTCLPRTPTDLDGDVVVPRFGWKINGVEVALGTPTYGPGLVRRGDTVACLAAPFDGFNEGPRLESRTVTILNTAPTVPVVEITPDEPTTRSDLLCDLAVPSTDADRDEVGYVFRWTRNGALWTGETSTTHFDGDTIPSANLGDSEVWACDAQATDGIEASAVSEASAPVTVLLGAVTYRIGRSELLNLTNDCSSGRNIPYTCSGNYGMSWTDTESKTPKWIIVEYYTGVNCTPGATRTGFLNGVGVGSATWSTTSACECDATSGKFALLTEFDPAGAYVPGASNRFEMTALNCEGFAPNPEWDNDYARVTVEY